MLQLLTKYLFQYKTVSIPQVGTIQLNQHPAQLDVVGKSLSPPSFFVELKRAEEVPEHQLNFFESFLGRTREEVIQELNFFGDNVHEKINGDGFEWKGLGLISRSTERLPVTVQAIQPVTAQKVTRADAQHHILVGDRHTTNVQMTEQRIVSDIVVRKKSWYVVAGWILLILSILAIVFFLYTGKFKVNSVGSKQNPLGYQHNNNTRFL